MFVLGVAHQVHRHVFDDGHVLRAIAASQPGEIVVEHDVEHPAQAVLDAPMGADRGGEGLGVELRRAEVIAPLPRQGAVSFDLAFDHADHGEMREARFVGLATVGEQPVDHVTDDMPALLDTAMIAVRGLMRRLQHVGGRRVEEGDDVPVEKRAIGLQRRQFVAAARNDLFRDVDLGSHGVDGDERAFEFEPFEQQRNGDDLVRLCVDGLLTEHEPLPGGPGGDEVQRLTALAACVAAP